MKSYCTFFFLNLILFIFLYSSFLLVIHFIHISVYMSIPISQFIPPPLSPLGVHTFVLYICVSISALQTGSSAHSFFIWILNLFWPIRKNYIEILIGTSINLCINIGSTVSLISDLVLCPSIKCYHFLHLDPILVFLDLFLVIYLFYCAYEWDASHFNFFFFFKIYLLFILFTFGCAGS